MPIRRVNDASGGEPGKVCAPGHPSTRGRAGRVTAVATMALALAACVSYAPRPLHPTESARHFEVRRLDAPTLRAAVQRLLPATDAAAWPPVWDRASLLAVALVQNPQLAVARAEVGAALAHEVSAGETPNPDLTLQSEYAPDESHPWLYGVGLDFLLRSPKRRHLDIDIAQLASANARWQVVEEVWIVRRNLVSALSDYEDARRRGALLDRLVAGQQQFVAVQKQRVDAGEDAPGELVVARSALLDAEQQRAQARADVETAQAALATVLGLPPAALDGVPVVWHAWGRPPPLDDVELADARERALLSRADLAAAIGDYAGAEKKLELAIAQQYPEFHLSPGYYWDHGVAKWPLDLGLALPVFNRNQGAIAEARAARDVAGRRMLALQANIQGKIDAALRAEKIAAANAQMATQRVEAANEQLRAARLGLKLGAIDRSAGIGAEALVLRAQLDALQTRARLQDARNALEDALHAPLSGPELALRTTLGQASPMADPAAAASSRTLPPR